MEFASPHGGRKNNDSIVKLVKCKDFAPLIDVGYGFGPPTPRENGRLKPHEKGRWLKKVIRNFGRQMNFFSFLGNAEIFRKMPKKGHSAKQFWFAEAEIGFGKNLPPRLWSSGSASVCAHMHVCRVRWLSSGCYRRQLCDVFSKVRHSIIIIGRFSINSSDEIMQHNLSASSP